MQLASRGFRLTEGMYEIKEKYRCMISQILCDILLSLAVYYYDSLRKPLRRPHALYSPFPPSFQTTSSIFAHISLRASPPSSMHSAVTTDIQHLRTTSLGNLSTELNVDCITRSACSDWINCGRRSELPAIFILNYPQDLFRIA